MKLFTTFFGILSVCAVSSIAQTPAQESRIFRTPIVSYDIRSDAEAARMESSQMYAPIIMRRAQSEAFKTVYSGLLTVPELWLDRQVNLHVEPNIGRVKVFVNGQFAGRCDDSRSGAEFDISRLVGFGTNGITVEKYEDGPGVKIEETLRQEYSPIENGIWVSAQPIISISDFSVAATRDTTGRDGILAMDIVIRNGYRTQETVSVGYDIYTPEGKLRNYNITEITVPRLGYDTIRFREAVWSAGKWLWSAEKPNLYKVMLYIKYGGKVIEYVPLKVGFGTSEFSDEGFFRNSRKVEISAVGYNAASRKDAEQKMLAFKRRGINTICVDYPQPSWFYDLCESKGFYVIDAVNIHADKKDGDRSVRGTVANAPEYVDYFIERAKNAYYRDRNRTCIIGWSIGSDSGNGYNMYKTYQWMKNADSIRPIIYVGAEGEWNSDMTMPEILSVEQAMQKAPRRR